MPSLDLAFALSASSIEANENFQKMKNILKSIVEKYGSSKIRYSVIVYGDNPSVKMRFSDIFTTDKNLMSFLDMIPRTSGLPSLQRVLVQAKRIFDESPRENARKALVIISDKKSGSRPENVREKAHILEEAGIKVIPVAFGNSADITELVLTTADNSSLIITKKADEPRETAEKILKEASKKGQPLFLSRVVRY